MERRAYAIGSCDFASKHVDITRLVPLSTAPLAFWRVWRGDQRETGRNECHVVALW
ncbi:hypothetical protein B0I35DRAFT_123338 [Stachybotrys elegans]|uniref:Uncharacterized protein n=1 Tax=Stachybotrys elegans TaxID=80388 RepID=A0A8K0SXT2_9HYPO|nr:hypothetical protein B0I35DRAFT_123338 [Stachybotrys elegans]